MENITEVYYFVGDYLELDIIEMSNDDFKSVIEKADLIWQKK